jgi:hypothetical protein
MLCGGQNMRIGNDPTVLPRMSHILDLMYKGGYTAAVDESKFFYQFKTHPDDRKYLGLVHPVTGIPMVGFLWVPLSLQVLPAGTALLS